LLDKPITQKKIVITTYRQIIFIWYYSRVFNEFFNLI